MSESVQKKSIAHSNVKDSLSSLFQDFADGANHALKIKKMSALAIAACDGINQSLGSSGIGMDIKVLTNPKHRVEMNTDSIRIDFRQSSADIFTKLAGFNVLSLYIYSDERDLFTVSRETNPLEKKFIPQEEFSRDLSRLTADEVIAEIPRYTLLALSVDERRKWMLSTKPIETSVEPQII